MAIFWTQKQDIGPSSRTAHGLAYDALRDHVIVFGGDPGGPPLGDTWAWDGKLWTQVADSGPSARHDAAMSYEPQTQRIVLFGGASGPSVMADTWEWDGAEWTQVADTGPQARAGHGMAYDSVRARIVLFGGASGTGLTGDTWTWDGKEWTQVQDVGPSARRGHAIAYDWTRQQVVLFGGAGADGTGRNDTWAWDGSTWTQIADTGPDHRVGSAMAANGGLVLFGGINSIDPALAPANRITFGDTWRWGANGWLKAQDIGPAPRWGHGMTYRTQAGKAMLFGGTTLFAPAQDAALSPGLRLDTWELPLVVPQPDVPPVSDVYVATVDVVPTQVMKAGDVLDVKVMLTGPAPVDLTLIIGFFTDDGSGNFVTYQPSGFDVPQSIMVAAGANQTQFDIIRNAIQLPGGHYAIGLRTDSADIMPLAYFTMA